MLDQKAVTAAEKEFEERTGLNLLIEEKKFGAETFIHCTLSYDPKNLIIERGLYLNLKPIGEIINDLFKRFSYTS
jgi:hypothetical protein